MKKYIKAILSLASVGMLFYIIYNQKEQIKDLKSSLNQAHQKIQTVDSLVRINDSLVSDLFIEHMNVERYEITLDRLKIEDSLSAAIFETYLSTTE
jgi:hypothetical protein